MEIRSHLLLTIDGRRRVNRRTVIVQLDEKDGVVYSLGSYGEVKAQTLYRWLCESAPATYKEIAAALDWSETTVRRYMKFLEGMKQVEQAGTGAPGNPYRWSALEAATEFSGSDATVPAARQDAFFCGERE